MFFETEDEKFIQRSLSVPVTDEVGNLCPHPQGVLDPPYNNTTVLILGQFFMISMTQFSINDTILYNVENVSLTFIIIFIYFAEYKIRTSKSDSNILAMFYFWAYSSVVRAVGS